MAQLYALSICRQSNHFVLIKHSYFLAALDYNPGRKILKIVVLLSELIYLWVTIHFEATMNPML